MPSDTPLISNPSTRLALDVALGPSTSTALNSLGGIKGNGRKSQAEIDEELRKKNEAVRTKQEVLGKEKEKLDAIKSETAKEVSATVNAPETFEQPESISDHRRLRKKK